MTQQKLSKYQDFSKINFQSSQQGENSINTLKRTFSESDIHNLESNVNVSAFSLNLQYHFLIFVWIV